MLCSSAEFGVQGEYLGVKPTCSWDCSRHIDVRLGSEGVQIRIMWDIMHQVGIMTVFALVAVSSMSMASNASKLQRDIYSARDSASEARLLDPRKVTSIIASISRCLLRLITPALYVALIFETVI